MYQGFILFTRKMLKCWNVGVPTNYFRIFFFNLKEIIFIFPIGRCQNSNIPTFQHFFYQFLIQSIFFSFLIFLLCRKRYNSSLFSRTSIIHTLSKMLECWNVTRTELVLHVLISKHIGTCPYRFGVRFHIIPKKVCSFYHYLFYIYRLFVWIDYLYNNKKWWNGDMYHLEKYYRKIIKKVLTSSKKK